MLEEIIPKDCCTLSEVSQLTSSCKAVVCAFIGEVFLQVSSMVLGDTEKAKIFLSRRVYKSSDNNLVEDLICTGCQLCGSPMGSEYELGKYNLFALLQRLLPSIILFLSFFQI